MNPKPGQAPPKLPLILLGLMTVATFAGPFVIALVIRGGRSTGWPPDRPVEWWTFGLICGGVAVLMVACLAIGFILKRGAPPEPAKKLQEETP